MYLSVIYYNNVMNICGLFLLFMISNVSGFLNHVSIHRFNNKKILPIRKVVHEIDYISNVKESLIINSFGYFLLNNTNQQSLTSSGLDNSLVLGLGLYSLLGFQGYSIAVVYFILGSLVTKVKKEKKEKLGIYEKREGKRGPENVWGSAGVAMVCAIVSYLYKDNTYMNEVIKIGYVSSFVTKLSDTFQSELGKAYGKNTILITNFKKVPPGTEGAISIEGYIFGIIGSFILSYFSFFIHFINSEAEIIICMCAALIANTIESYLGATIQNKNYIVLLTNEQINFFNTLIGSLVAMVIYIINT